VACSYFPVVELCAAFLNVMQASDVLLARPDQILSVAIDRMNLKGNVAKEKILHESKVPVF
jgi:hypothetical protein